jgi:hypothetical protein
MEDGKREIEKLDRLITLICHKVANDSKWRRATSNFVSHSKDWTERVEDFRQEVWVRILKREDATGPGEPSLASFLGMHENQQAKYVLRVADSLKFTQHKKGDVLQRKNFDTNVHSLPVADLQNSEVVNRHLETLTTSPDYDWSEEPDPGLSDDEKSIMQKFERIKALVQDRAFKKLTERQKDIVRYYLTCIETELGSFRFTRQEFAKWLGVQPKTLDVWTKEGRIEKLKKVPSTLCRFDGGESYETIESNGNGKTTYFDFVQSVRRLLTFEENKREVGS